MAKHRFTKRAPASPPSGEGPGPEIGVSRTVRPKAPVELLPYQLRWVQDNAPLKIVVKARQTGYSFSSTLRAVMACIERRTTWVFLSKGERQSRMLMEKVSEHVQSMGLAARMHDSQFFQGTLVKQLEARFPNGSVIYGLPANPDTARGYTGHVTLDEFAFHADAEKIYAALYPVVTRGFGLEVISTPNGQQGKYFELAKAAGLVDGVRTPANTWSTHKTPIESAVEQGLQVDLERLRAGVDDETWQQEFCCAFVTGASEWIGPELFESCVSAEASVQLSPFSGQPAESRTLNADGCLYAGWDIARNRDLSVIWINELAGDVTWTRGVIEMRNTPTPDQLKRARSLMPLLARINIDKSGMGLAIAEQLEREFPGKAQGIQFTQPAKEALAVHARRRMEERKVRIPDDERIRASFRSLKRTQNAAGQVRFDTEHDAASGHADHWWAFAMAEMACQSATQETPDLIYHLAETGSLAGRPAFAGLGGAVL